MRRTHAFIHCLIGCPIFLAMGVVACAQAAPQSTEPLKLIQTIPLPGVSGRIDHMAVDVTRQRLYVAALGNNTIEVVDLTAGKRVRSLTGFQEPQGVVYLPDSNRVFVSNGGDGSCQFYDCDSFHLVSSLSLGDDADNARFDPGRRSVYVGYGEGGLAAIGASDEKLLGRIKLSGHPESFQVERLGTRAFVNVPGANEIAVVEIDSQRVVARWGLGEFHSNFPMALSEAAHRLYVGCRTPPALLVYNTKSGQSVAQMHIAADVDDIFCDEVRQRLYLSYGEGLLEVMQVSSGDRVVSLATVATRKGARTCLFVPELDRIYVAAPRRDDHDAEIEVFAIQQ